MKKTIGVVLTLGLTSSFALADWQPFLQDKSSVTHYEVGAVKRADGGLLLVEFKRSVIQLKGSGLVVIDQFVAGCTEKQHSLVMLLKMQGSVHVNEGEKLRTLSNEKFDPPKEIPLGDTNATELAIKVCELTRL